VSNDKRHRDEFNKTDGATGTTPSAPGKVHTKAIDNADQAAAATREREHTVGGGGDESPRGPGSLPLTEPPVPLAATIARVRAPDRPSPFGVGQFPPLPTPPGVDTKR
jgi:hypothetical protein